MCGCDKRKKHHKKRFIFKFSKNDPNFISTDITVNQSTTNDIEHVFVRSPIYTLENKQIGYKVSDDYVQQVDTGKYVVRLNNTYVFYSKGVKVGSISWQYVFVNTTNSVYYPVNVANKSTIISGTGKFVNAKGTVTLIAKPDGDRFVYIKFQ